MDLAHQSVLRSLEKIWMSFIDSSSNYIQGLNRPHSSSIGENDEDLDFGKRGGSQKTLGTNREYWVNLTNSLTQWVRPYYDNTFRTQDIELETFVSIVIQKDIFAQRSDSFYYYYSYILFTSNIQFSYQISNICFSPLIELMNIAPKDLWPNADMFHKQVKERLQKEKASNQPVISRTGTWDQIQIKSTAQELNDVIEREPTSPPKVSFIDGAAPSQTSRPNSKSSNRPGSSRPGSGKSSSKNRQNLPKTGSKKSSS